MRLIVWIVFCLAIVPAASAVAQPDDADDPESLRITIRPTLYADRFYNRVDRPLMMTVIGDRTFGTFELVLMNEAGVVLAGPIEVRGGRLDLAEVMPEIWQIRRAAYLQLFDLGEPQGAALVLEPMLSRLVPVTKPDVRSSGSRYTRIDGWRDENVPEPEPKPEETDANPGAAASAASAPDEEPQRSEDDSGSDGAEFIG